VTESFLDHENTISQLKVGTGALGYNWSRFQMSRSQVGLYCVGIMNENLALRDELMLREATLMQLYVHVIATARFYCD